MILNAMLLLNLIALVIINYNYNNLKVKRTQNSREPVSSIFIYFQL